MHSSVASARSSRVVGISSSPPAENAAPRERPLSARHSLAPNQSTAAGDMSLGPTRDGPSSPNCFACCCLTRMSQTDNRLLPVSPQLPRPINPTSPAVPRIQKHSINDSAGMVCHLEDESACRVALHKLGAGHAPLCRLWQETIVCGSRPSARSCC